MGIHYRIMMYFWSPSVAEKNHGHTWGFVKMWDAGCHHRLKHTKMVDFLMIWGYLYFRNPPYFGDMNMHKSQLCWCEQKGTWVVTHEPFKRPLKLACLWWFQVLFLLCSKPRSREDIAVCTKTCIKYIIKYHTTGCAGDWSEWSPKMDRCQEQSIPTMIWPIASKSGLRWPRFVEFARYGHRMSQWAWSAQPAVLGPWVYKISCQSPTKMMVEYGNWM